MRHAIALIVLTASICSASDDKTKIMVRAVSHASQLNQSTSSYSTPGTSNTNCSGSATTAGNTTNGTANCQTTSTPAQTHQIATSTLDVKNVVEANGMRYVIVCRASWRGSNCEPLNDGDVFPAEIDGTTMWIEARRGGNQGKKIRTKYRILDIRAVEDSPQFALATAASAQALHFTDGLEVTSKLGTKFYSLADEKGVIAEARENLAADPKNPALLLKLAQAQFSVWENKEAAETLTRALVISPQDAGLLIERGHRELPLREFTKARADLTRGAALSPKTMAAYYHLGLAHYFLGEFAESADAFHHAVETAPDNDERINATNWLYASLRRAGKRDEAAKALEAVPPDMTNTAPHTRFYLNLVRFFQGKMSESDALPPEPPAGNTDQEVELPFDTVAYGIGNWHLYNGDTAKAQEYFRRIMKGHVWVTWGFVGAETELLRKPK